VKRALLMLATAVGSVAVAPPVEAKHLATGVDGGLESNDVVLDFLAGITAGLQASAPAVRVVHGCTDDPLCTLPAPPDPPDPLEGLYGRYSCRFARAGHVTPCCPDAVPMLAQFWSGEELAVADYVIGRESGCNAGIVNSSRCVGWWQMCGKSCPPNGCADAWSATVKAKELYDNRRWCDWYLAGDPVTGRACR
jgi:hypothetical protein